MNIKKIEMIHKIVDEWSATNPNQPISMSEIVSRVKDKFGFQNEATIEAQTTRITVNDTSRWHYGSKETRIAQSHGYYDYLYKPESGTRAYVKYDPVKHGFWGVFEGDDAGKRVVQKIEPLEMNLRQLHVSEDDNVEEVGIDDEQSDDISVDFPQPHADSVEERLAEWKKMENYQLQERCIRKLFDATHPNNGDINEILVKIAVLNDFYSTNIKIPKPDLAKRIHGIDNLDARLRSGDPTVVSEIAENEIVDSEKPKKIVLYSFATKYAHHHNQQEYPIYDRFVAQALKHFRKELDDFRNEDLKLYPKYKEIIETFRRRYKLTQFSIMEIDKYLWLLGRNGSK